MKANRTASDCRLSLRVVPPYFKSRSFASLKVTVSLWCSTALVFWFFLSITTSQSFSCRIYCFLSFSICFTLLLLFQCVKEQKVPREWCQVHLILFACKEDKVFSVGLRYDQANLQHLRWERRRWDFPSRSKTFKRLQSQCGC